MPALSPAFFVVDFCPRDLKWEDALTLPQPCEGVSRRGVTLQ